MEPLYERLLKKPFPDSVSAIEYCRSVCAEFGFTVKQEASANRVKTKIFSGEEKHLTQLFSYLEHICLLFKRRFT
jgi:hypothetical protein